MNKKIFIYFIFLIHLAGAAGAQELTNFPVMFYSNYQTRLKFEFEIASLSCNNADYRSFINIKNSSDKKTLALEMRPKAIGNLPSNLIITVTERAPKKEQVHSFLLIYKENFEEGQDDWEYDFSSVRKKDDYIASVKKRRQALNLDAPVQQQVQVAPPAVTQPVVTKPAPNTTSATVTDATTVEERFQQAKAAGDNHFFVSNMEQARISYEQARQLKPNDTYINKRLGEIRQRQEDQRLLREKESREAQASEQRYRNAMQMGEDNLKAGRYYSAQNAFMTALIERPDDKAAREKKTEVDTLLKRQQETERDYNTAIENGNLAFTQRQYSIGLEWFEKAQSLKPAETLPKQKIQQIRSKVAEEEEQQRQAAELEKRRRYDAAMKPAEAAFAKRDWNTAESYYREMLVIKVGDAYAIQKLDDIKAGRIADESVRMQREEMALQKKVNDAYNQEMTLGDMAIKARKWDEAENHYLEAAKIKPSENQPQLRMARIATVKDSLAMVERKQLEALELNNKKKQFDGLMLQGNKALAAKDYDAAATSYTAAMQLQPDAEAPQLQLRKIEEIKRAAEAKLAADKEKTEALRVKNEQYDAAINLAATELAAQNFDAATAACNNALTLKPGDAQATIKLAQIKKAKADLAEQQRLAVEQEKNDRYDTAMALGMRAYLANEFDAAVQHYTMAKAVFPDRNTPDKQISAVETRRRDKAEQDSIALERKYAQLLVDGEMAIETGDLAAADKLYLEAKGLKPGSKKVLQMLGYLNDPGERGRLQKISDFNRYKKLLNDAGVAENGGDLAQAKKLLLEAIPLKPNDNLPARIDLQRVEKKMGGAITPLDALQPAAQPVVQNNNTAKTPAAPAGKAGVVTQPEVQPVEKPAEKPAAEKPQPVENAPVTEAVTTPAVSVAAANEHPEPEPVKIAAQPAYDPAKGLVLQETMLPLPAAELLKLHPDIDFTAVPERQKFTTDYYSHDTITNYEQSMLVIKQTARLRITDSLQQVSVTLENIGFSANNAYFKLVIRNYGNTEFITGNMQLSLQRKDGTVVNYAPCYMSGFPYVLPGHYATVVYVARTARMADDEAFQLTVTERRKKTLMSLQISGAKYNNEKDSQ